MRTHVHTCAYMHTSSHSRALPRTLVRTCSPNANSRILMRAQAHKHDTCTRTHAPFVCTDCGCADSAHTRAYMRAHINICTHTCSHAQAESMSNAHQSITARNCASSAKRRCTARYVPGRLGTIQQDMARFGTARYSAVRHGTIWRDTPQQGMARHGTVWACTTQCDTS
jgi:hypothetical protein